MRRNRCTHRIRLVHEAFYENVEQLVGVVDLVGVFPDNPNERCFRLRLVELVEVGTQRRDHALVCGGVFPEDVLSASHPSNSVS
jgi:hypothetical protein